MDAKSRFGSLCLVNTKLLPVKLAYFLLLSALSALLPYLPMFMGVLKLTPVQMSIILSTATAFSAPIRLFVGYVADRLEKRNLVYAVASMITSIFHLSLYFTPMDQPATVNPSLDGLAGNICLQSNYLNFEFLNETILIGKEMVNASVFGSSLTQMSCCIVGSNKTLETSRCVSFAYTQDGSNNFLVGNQSIVTDDILSVENFNIDAVSRVDKCVHFDSCNATIHTEVSHHNNKTFWIFFILYFFAQAAFSPLQNILDSLIYSFLKSTGKLEDFGKSRLWGTIGFGLFAFLAGLILDALSKFGWKDKSPYSVGFGCFATGIMLSAVATMFIRVSPSRSSRNGNTSKNGNALKSEQFVVKNYETSTKDETPVEASIFDNKKEIIRIFCGFYLNIIIMTGMVAGILAGCLEGFFYYFLTSLDPNNKSVVGVSLAISCVCEVIVLLFSGNIMKLIGYQKCLYLIFLVFAIRFVGSSYIQNPWLGVITESSQCICFGLLYPVMSSWASSLVPVQLQSTVQCYIGAIYFSLGRAVGAGIAGVIYEVYGPRVMFLTFAAIAGGYLVVLVVTFEVLDKVRLKRKSADQTADKNGPVLIVDTNIEERITTHL